MVIPSIMIGESFKGVLKLLRSQSSFSTSRPLEALVKAHPAVSLQTWVDDVSFDIHSRDADFAAREAVGAFRTLKWQMEEAGLRLNTDKTGFLTSSKEAARARTALLQEGDPEHYDILRDLGVDSTAGRRRRVTQIRKRFLKGKGRVVHYAPPTNSSRHTLQTPQRSGASSDVVGGASQRISSSNEATIQNPCWTNLKVAEIRFRRHCLRRASQPARSRGFYHPPTLAYNLESLPWLQ